MLLGAAFENRGERLAWSAPVSPEIDDDRKVVGALHDLCLECLLVNVHTLLPAPAASPRSVYVPETSVEPTGGVTSRTNLSRSNRTSR